MDLLQAAISRHDNFGFYHEAGAKMVCPESEGAGEQKRVCVCTCMRMCASNCVNVCVCVCMRVRDRDRDKDRERQRERERERERERGRERGYRQDGAIRVSVATLCAIKSCTKSSS